MQCPVYGGPAMPTSLVARRLPASAAVWKDEVVVMRRLFAALYETLSKSSEAAGMRDERRRLLARAEGATFDTVVVTYVLCSVPDQDEALAEVARVLKPEGRLLFLEHVRSADPNLARRQDRMRPLYNLFGCNPNRDTLARIQGSPLTVESVEHGEVPKAPKVGSPLIVGTARR